MTKFHKLVAVCLLTSLLAACSKEPSESEVEYLIQSKYDQTQDLMNDAMATTSGGNSEMAEAMGNMVSGLMPKLEGVENVNCDSIEGDNTYMCTADIHQVVAGKSSVDKASFKVYRINEEWVLAD